MITCSNPPQRIRAFVQFLALAAEAFYLHNPGYTASEELRSTGGEVYQSHRRNQLGLGILTRMRKAPLHSMTKSTESAFNFLELSLQNRFFAGCRTLGNRSVFCQRVHNEIQNLQTFCYGSIGKRRQHLKAACLDAGKY